MTTRNWSAHPALRLLGGVACAATLIGCSSRPESGDIERELTRVNACGLFEIKDVKKLNGESGPQGTYDVAFSNVLVFKGGDQGAAKFLAEAHFLRQEVARLRSTDDEARIQRRIAELFAPCETSGERFYLWPMVDEVAADLEAHKGRIAFPIGVRQTQAVRFSKTENGWQFRAKPETAKSELLYSETINYPHFEPIRATAEPPTAGAPPSGERTIVGTIRAGLTDSCLAVTAGGAEKYYGLPGEPAQVQRIFGVCKDGDLCAITGQFDDKAESLGAFSKVENASR